MIRQYKIIGEWEISTGGHTAWGEKGGKRYFLKEYGTLICPTHNMVTEGVLTEKMYQKKKEKFERFFEWRSNLNEKLRSMVHEGGNIICPLEWGTYEGKFVEATEFVPGLLSQEQIERLDIKEKILILLTAIGALRTVHRLDIIHGDLKYSNIAVAKNSMGTYVGKLIDFDCSYFYSQKPSDLGGDQVYMAPEVGVCYMTEMSPESIDKVSFKADIFSLGVLFHEYVTGKRPEIDVIPREMEGKEPELIYYWEYILYGGRPKVSEKIRNARLAALILRMLDLDPSKRPTADEALDELKIIRGEIESGVERTNPKGYPLPWPEHEIEFAESALDSIYYGGKRVNSDGKKTYEFWKKYGGEIFPHTKESLISKGLAVKVAPPVKDEPWPEHKIKYVESAIRSMKFVAWHRIEVGGKKAYEFSRANGAKIRYTREKLLSVGLAVSSDVTPPPPPPGKEEPWPEHNIEFITSEIERMKFVSYRRIERVGKKAYEFVRENGQKIAYTKESAIANGLAREK